MRRAPREIIRATRDPRRGRARSLSGAIGLVAMVAAALSFIASGSAVASSPNNATFTPGSTTANATSTWIVGFTTSSGGALSSSDTISVVFNSAFPIENGRVVAFTGFGSSCGSATDSVSAHVVTVTLGSGCSLGKASSGFLSIPGVTNPGAGTYPNTTFSVATSKDTSAVSGASDIVITSATTVTTTSLSVSPFPAPAGAHVTLHATVSPTTASGNVDFFANGSPITGCVEVALSSGAASCTTTYTATGSTPFVATYSGAPDFDRSVSKTLVLPVPTRTTLILRKASDPLGKEQRQRITVTVSPMTGHGAVTGRVRAMAGRETLCVITLAGNRGRCHLSAQQLHPHTYRIYAVYEGTSSFATSRSGKHLYRVIGPRPQRK